MWMQPECPPCLLNRILFEADLVDSGDRTRIMEESLAMLANGFHQFNSARLATRIHARAYELIGVPDPYHELKLRSDDVANGLIGRAQEFVDSSNDTLEAASLCAIAGNVMDFGGNLEVKDPEELNERFDGIVSAGLAVNDLGRVMDVLQESGRALYLFDNCGESVLDALLIKEIQSFGVKVTGVVKGEPILTDVTYEDAERVGLTDLLDNVEDTGGFAIGVDMDIIPDSLREEFRCADIIIAKGMANFEALSETPPGTIAYFLRAKCWPVARTIGAQKDDNVVRVYD